MTTEQTKWIGGHRIFFVLIQGITVALRRFVRAAEREDLVAAAAWLAVATRLFRASAAALRYSADFKREAYDQGIVLTMPSGFSGLMNADHAELVEALKTAGPLLRRLKSRLRSEHDAFTQAQLLAHSAHVGVCARFGGSDRPSIHQLSNGSPKTAVEVLDRLGTSRINLVQGANERGRV